MTAQTVPRTRRTAQNVQHTYNVNRRIHDAKTYPVLSPQGATILIYGHESGVTVIWQGGRRLKSPKAQESQQPAKVKSNGAEDAVMIIDSDDEVPPAPAAPFMDKPEFEDAEIDSHPSITQTLDLSLGTDVLHVAVLPMGPCAAEDAAWGGADILKEKMVFAISCSTTDTYVVTLPLTPPSHESKARPELRVDLLAGSAGKGAWGETLISLGGQVKYSDGLAMTLVKQRSQSTDRSKSRDRARPTTRVIVAAHSREAAGTLRFWDVSLGSKRPPDRSLEPFQTEYLPAPLTSLAFNPTHVTQLLVVNPLHAVRIYDYSVPSIPADDTSEGPFPSQGSWLLSLYPPFARNSPTLTSRKPIVGASWIAHGRAVITLLADGQWGIWDIEGVGPSSSGFSAGLFGNQGSGIKGAALSAFSASGFVEGTSPLRNPGSQRSSGPASGEFVPMTPHTRRESLVSSFAGGPEKLAAVRGGIDVFQLPPTRGSGTGDESAVLWIGGSDQIVSVIPIISRFWDAQLRRGSGGGANPFIGTQMTRMTRIAELNTGLLGERCCGATAITRFHQQRQASSMNGSNTNGNIDSSKDLPVEILVWGESRLVIIQENDGAITTASVSRKLKRLMPAAAPPEPVTAITVFPRPEKSAVNFDLSVSRGGSVRGARGSMANGSRAPAISLFNKSVAQSGEMDVDSAQPDFTNLSLPTRPRNAGLDFANDLDAAADATYDVDAEERDIDQEVMDIMELDRELEFLEEERQAGTKRVFFEEG